MEPETHLIPEDAERDANGEPYWLWRYMGRGYAASGGVEITRERYHILSRTPKTFLIATPFDGPKRVLRGRGKRFAHEERAWAWESFIRRQARRRKILNNALSDAELLRRHIELLGTAPKDNYYVYGSGERFFERSFE